jgi:hypothetical protein
MFDLKSVRLGGATLCCALAIGYVMQYGGAPEQQAAQAEIDITSIQDTSSAVVPQTLPEVSQPQAKIALSIDTPNATQPEAPLPVSAPAPDIANCTISLAAREMAGAMVELQLKAPCNANERVTLHHQGMMFSEQLSAMGTLTTKVPALMEDANFFATLSNGAGATANAKVPSLQFYDRVVVQWKGQAGLQLHAREFGADYFEEGHVWQGKSGNLSSTALGMGGFMMRLGREESADAAHAEVYSFPSGTIQKAGTIAMTVEAEVTAQNCENRVEAQTLEIRGNQSLRVRDLSVEIPSCGSVGDVLVLKNLVEDLTIAAN